MNEEQHNENNTTREERRFSRKLYLSPIEAYTNKLKAKPRLDGASGAPDIVPGELIAEAHNAVKHRSECYGYPGAGGPDEARQAYSEYVSKILGFPKVKPDEVIATAGAQHALKMLSQLTVENGTPVLVENPGFIEGRMPIEYEGAALSPINVDFKGNAAVPDGEYRLAYTVPTAHNPLGVDYTPESRSMLARLAEKGVLVVEDDPYRALHPNPPPPVWRPGSNVAYVGSMSKVLAPGIRAGFIIPPPSMVEPLELLSQHDFAANRVAGCIIEYLLDTGELEGHVEVKRRLYVERLGEMKKSLGEELPEAEISDARGGFFITIRTGCDAYRLLERAVSEGVTFVPVRDFYIDNPLEDAVRVSVARLPLDSIREYAGKLAGIIRECWRGAYGER